MSIYWIIFIVTALASWFVQASLQSKFKKYSQVPIPNGMTCADISRKMLRDNGIMDVKVTWVPCHLTDHSNTQTAIATLS